MLQKLQRLHGEPSGRVLYAGTGNVLRSDDGAGVYICRQLSPTPTCEILLAETSIENYIGRINRSGADVLVLVDCVDFGKAPGHYDLLPAGDLIDLTSHTHNISLGKISGMFRMPVWILGIQPADTSFGEELSEPVGKAAGSIVRMIASVCGKTP